MTLQEFHQLSQSDAIAALLRCCGSRAWSQEMEQARPFVSLADLQEHAIAVWESLGREDWLEAFSHHPRIGDRQALAAKYSSTRDWSANEQAGVAVAEEEVLDRLATGNAEYETRFGFVFLVCATGKTAAQMLSLLEQRLPHSPEDELQIAQGEQQKIMLLRMEKLFSTTETT